MRRRGRPFRLCLLLLCGAAGAARAQGRAGLGTEEEQAFQAAEAAFKDNRDDEAARLYQRVTSLNPARSEAWVKHGVILYKHGRYPEAAALLGRALEVVPGDAAVSGQLGLTLYRMDRVPEAVRLLEGAVARTPDAYQLQLQLGQHYVGAGDGRRGATALLAYLAARPAGNRADDLPVRALLGEAYLLDHRFVDAGRELELALRARPGAGGDAAGELRLREQLLEVATALGAWSRGVVLGEPLVEEGPRQPLVWLRFATCLFRLHRLAYAERVATQYLGAVPDDPRGHALLGDILAERHQLPRALEAWAAARTRLAPGTGSEPERLRLLSREGQALLSLGRYQPARAAFEEGRRIRPDDAALLAGLADAEVGAGLPREALLARAEALRGRPEAEVQLGAGALLYAAGDDERALGAFRAAAARDPRSFRARVGQRLSLVRLAQAALAGGRLARAEELLVAAQAVDPESVVVNKDLGLVQLLAGHAVEAEAALRRALRRVEHDLPTAHLLGRALLAQGRRDEAVAQLEAAAQAARSARSPLVADLGAELGAIYLEQGRVDPAVTVLDAAVAAAGSARPGREVAARNLALALLRRGLARLADGPPGEAAIDDLARASAARGALSAKESAAALCAWAVAALRAGRPQAAFDALSRARGDGGCQLKPPYDAAGPELLTAYAGYRDGNPAHREAAARVFARLAAAAPPALAEILGALARSAYELLGVDQYNRGEVKRAAATLRAAARMPGPVEHRELDNNLAVLDIEEGRTAEAARALELLGGRPPEALVNLGLLRDREGDGRKALELYKRAAERGARAPHLREWIDLKERVFARASGAR